MCMCIALSAIACETINHLSVINLLLGIFSHQSYNCYLHVFIFTNILFTFFFLAFLPIYVWCSFFASGTDITRRYGKISQQNAKYMWMIISSVCAVLTWKIHIFSYTPIPNSYAPFSSSDEADPSFYLYLLIKTYVNGALTNFITSDLPLAHDLIISHPKGNFQLCQVKEFRRIAVLAAGSGITPMFAIFDYLLERRSNQM